MDAYQAPELIDAGAVVEVTRGPNGGDKNDRQTGMYWNPKAV